MKDILRRVKSTDGQLAAEMIARGAFSRADVAILRGLISVKPRARQHATLERIKSNWAMIGAVSYCFIAKKRYPAWAFNPGFVPMLAQCDRQLAIHAVINASLTDAELAQLDKLTALQVDGHLLRQLRVAIEIETDRRKQHARRGGGNRVATQVG
jgi:hypothetical protein